MGEHNSVWLAPTILDTKFGELCFEHLALHPFALPGRVMLILEPNFHIGHLALAQQENFPLDPRLLHVVFDRRVVDDMFLSNAGVLMTATGVAKELQAPSKGVCVVKVCGANVVQSFDLG